jgi:hypothetical protein
VKKDGEGMTQAAPVRSAKSCMEVTLAEDAAIEIAKLSKITGLSAESLLETSIGLLKVAVGAREHGKRIVITTKAWWPIKELVLPK